MNRVEALGVRVGGILGWEEALRVGIAGSALARFWGTKWIEMEWNKTKRKTKRRRRNRRYHNEDGGIVAGSRRCC